MPSARRFPPPWTIEEANDACFIVTRSRTARRSAYVYFEDEPGRRAAANLLTKDEARRIADHTSPSCRSCCAGAPPTNRGVTRLRPRHYTTVRAMSAYPPIRKYRRSALSDVERSSYPFNLNLNWQSGLPVFRVSYFAQISRG